MNISSSKNEEDFGALKLLLSAHLAEFKAFVARLTNGMKLTDQSPLVAIPEILGYEKLLRDTAGYNPIAAKLIALFIRRIGQNLADEINEGRRVSKAAGKVAQVCGGRALVLSRRATNFRDSRRSIEAQDFIDQAIAKSGLSVTSNELGRIVELACNRDETACQELGRICSQLTKYLPDKRGRPISVDTCTHYFLLRHFDVLGKSSAYTYSEDTDKGDINNKGDFVDKFTAATRKAMDNKRFSPLYANKLRNARKGDLPI